MIKTLNVGYVYLSGDVSCVGGIQKLAHEICKRHIQNGHKAIVITALDSSKVNDRIYDFNRSKIYRLPIFRRVLGKTIYKGFGHINLLKLMWILKKENVDIVQVMDIWLYHGYVARMSKLLGLKVVSSISSSAAEFASEKEKNLLQKYSDVIVAASEYNKNKFGVSNDKIAVIPLGSDKKVLNQTQKKEDIVLSVGRIDRRKNYETLIETAKRVVIKNKNVKFYVVGAVDYPDYMEKLNLLVKRYKLEKHILFVGYVSDVELDELYKKSKIFYLPSKHEMFGIAFTEAMSYGLPIVSSNTTAIPETVGDAGILLDANDYNAHAKAILSLLGNDKLYGSFSNKALKRANTLTWDNTYNKFLEIYRRLEGNTS